MHILLLIAGLLSSGCGEALAQSAALGLYNEANALYRRGEFQAARDKYLQVTQAGVKSSVIGSLNGPVGLDYEGGCLFYTDDLGVFQYDFVAPNSWMVFDYTTVGVAVPETTRIVADTAQNLTFLSTSSIWRLQ